MPRILHSCTMTKTQAEREKRAQRRLAEKDALRQKMREQRALERLRKEGLLDDIPSDL